MRNSLSLSLLVASSFVLLACDSSSGDTDFDDASSSASPDPDGAGDVGLGESGTEGDDASDGDGSFSAVHNDAAQDSDAGEPVDDDAGPSPGNDAAIEPDGSGSGPSVDAAMDASVGASGGGDTGSGGADASGGTSDSAVPDGSQPDAGPVPYLCGQGPQTAGVLLDVGGPLDAVGRTATRVLTAGDGGRWVLWDAIARTQIGSGIASSGTPSMGGGHFAVKLDGGVEVRSLDDGHVISMAGGVPQAQLSVDGSYLWTLNGSQQLLAWSLAGTPLVDKPDYAGVNIAFAAAGELRVARNLNTDNVINTVTIATGATVTSAPYSGQFRSWFQDGEHFFTSATGVVRVYSKTATAPQLFAVTPASFDLKGQGGHFWITASNYVAIYRLGTSAPVFEGSYPAVTPNLSGSRVWFTRGEGHGTVLEVFDLSGPAVTRTTTPVSWTGGGVVASDASGGWVGWRGTCHTPEIGDIDEPSVAPRALGCGWLRGIAGSQAGRVAVLLCERILWFKVNGGAKQLEGSVAIDAQLSFSKIELSNDGSILAATDGRTIKLYHLPSGELFETISYPPTSGGWPYDLSFVLSDSASVIGQTKCDSAQTCQRIATSQDGATSRFTSAGYDNALGGGGDINGRFWSFAISPNDARFAISTGGENSSTAAQLYEGNSLIGAADGYLVDWLSNDQLLVNRYRIDRFGPGGYSYTKAQVVDGTGAVLRDLSQLPHLTGITRVAEGQIYGHQTNRIYSTVDASVLWSSPNRAAVAANGAVGDVAADRVVFLSGTPYASGGAPAVTSHLIRSEAR